ncbi:MAG: NosD domain-containing protein [Candidatus Thorarchaeota archaeon]
MINRTKIILIFLIFGINFSLLMVSIYYFNLSIINNNDNGNDGNDEDNPTILIDGDGVYNWAWAVSQPWCDGSGTLNDPYVIENLDINGTGYETCIQIRDSSVFFLIKGCNISNGDDEGIYLINVQNGLINNNLIANNRYGIRLENCNNNNISGNIINLNVWGIHLYNSNSNYLYGNLLKNNRWYGIMTYSSNQIRIYQNNITTSDSDLFHAYGIKISYCENNILIENKMSGCGIGIEGHLNDLISHDINITNKVNEKSVYYYKNQLGLDSDNFTNSGQIILVNCNNSILSQMNFVNSTEGISLFYCSNNLIIENNITYNTDFGIFLLSSNENNITKNNVNSNIDFGIRLEESNYNKISENSINNNGCGIELDNSTYNKILGNIANWNRLGIRIEYDSNYNKILTNKIKRSRDEGIDIVYSFGNNISGTEVNYNSREGISLSSSNNNIIFNNNAYYNDDGGIELWWCNDNIITGNTLTYNTLSGLRISGDRNIVRGNTLTNNNRYGIELQSSDWNIIFLNYLIDNLMINAFDNYGSNNQWDNGSIGNFWSDYSGFDANDNGIGDSPYIVNGDSGSQDNFPIWDDGPG